MTGRDPDALRTRAGVSGDPQQDQHFLIDDRVLDRLPTYATEVGADTNHVLEIGAGTGALTDRLLETADHVTAIERDTRLVSFLREEFAAACRADRLTIVAGDALELSLPSFTASVSNLPYGVASQLLFRLLPADRPLVCTVQREFADRLIATAGDDAYGRLSVTAGQYADIEIVETVPPAAFEPQPAVQSAVVRATPCEPTHAIADEEFFARFVRAVFTQRRKTVRNAIRNTTHISGLEAPEAVVTAAADQLLSKRAGDLSPAAFAELAELARTVGAPADEP
jgi:dimethyladenosine transferase (EC 2.1.1.-)